MKRKEFIETSSGLSRSELLEIAVNARKNVEKMISEDTKAMFHRLDEETVVEERYFETGWGKTHVYVVRSLNHKDEKLPGSKCPWWWLDFGTFGTGSLFLPSNGTSGGMCSF